VNIKSYMLVAFAVALAATAWGQVPPAAASPLQEQIAPQPVSTALAILARQSGLQLIYGSETVKGLQSKGSPPGLSAREALGRVLDGTGLTYEFLNDHTVTIVAPATGSAASSANSSSRFSEEGEGARKADAAGAFRLAQGEETQGSQSDIGTQASGKGSGPSVEMEPDQQTYQRKPIALEEVVVTGTHIRGTEEPIGTHLITITAEDIETGGFVTAQDAVRSLPQNFNGTVSDDKPTALVANGAGAREGVQNYSAAAALDLRGLGADSTLVLMNGHRLSPGGGLASFVDVSSIPMAAVDHIEVLPDGASAIYGADAIGGVVNFVLKRDYSGADTTLQFGHVTAGGLSDANFGQTFGTQWSSGSILLAVSYRNRTSLTANERPQETASDLSSRGGDNFSLGYCNPGTLIDSNGQQYAIPVGQNGMHLAPSSLTPGTQANCSNLNNGDLYPSQRQYNFYTYLDQRVTDNVKLFADISFADRRDKQTSANATAFSVPSSNPFYVNPAGGTDPVTVEYDFFQDLGPARTDSDTKTLNVTAGITWSIAADWAAEVSASEAAQRLDFSSVGTESFDELNAVLSVPNPSTAFNPFGAGSFTNPNTLATLDATRQTERFTSSSTIQSADVTTSGLLFQLPGGEVKAAFGCEFRKEIYATNDSQTNYELGVGGILPVATPIAADLSRSIGAIFAEATVPLVGANNAFAAVEALDLSIAGRFEHYSDFGSTSVPRIGLRWKPLDRITLRGSWSRSFRAPDLPDLSEAQNAVEIAKLPDLASPSGFTNALFIGGGNATLKPERANIWSTGFDIAPSPSFPVILSTTYFNIRFNDRVSGLPSRDYFGDPADAFAINRNPTAAQQAAACSGGFYYGNFSGAPGTTCTTTVIEAIIDARTHNATSVRQDGMDLNGTYSLATALGKYVVGVNVTHLFGYSQQPTPTSSSFDLLNTPYYPLATRLRGSVGWSFGGYSATAFYNYSGSYTDNTSIPSRSIAPWSTVDLNLAYRFSTYTGSLGNSQIAINVQNLFDRSPPFYNNPLGIAYDPVNADPLGRFVLLSLRKSW
jgi:iron complex outermembrane recepter protein